MSLERAMEVVEDSNLPSTIAEDVQNSLGFTQAVHDLFKDYGVVSTEEVDVRNLEKAIEAILGENAAAALFLASFSNSDAELAKIGEKLEGTPDVPEIIITGYKKLAERVKRTREST